MKFHRTVDSLGGTCLQGWVRVTYARLLQTLGEPEHWDEDCPAYWALEFEDGTKASVYVHKPAEHRHRSGEIPTREFLWHVGGFNLDAVIRVAEILETEPICWDHGQSEARETDDIPF